MFHQVHIHPSYVNGLRLGSVKAEEVNMDVDTVLGVEKMMDIDPPCK